MRTKEKKLFIVCSDAGAAQAVVLSYDKLKMAEMNITVIARNSGYRFFCDAGISVCGRKEAYSDYAGIRRFLAESGPDAILTGTSVKDDLERDYIKAGRDLNIAVISFVDWWTNFKLRFVNVRTGELCLPDWICVVDDTARKLCARELGGIPNTVVTGNPYFNYVAERKVLSVRGRDMAIKSLDLDPCLATILFFPEPSDPPVGYDQFRIFKALALAISKAVKSSGRSFNLIIKFHPNGERDDIYKRYEDIAGSLLSGCVNVKTVKKQYNMDRLIEISDYVWGMCTTPLLEAMIRGKLTSSFAPGIDIPGIPFLKSANYCASEDKFSGFYGLVRRLLTNERFRAGALKRQNSYRLPEENFVPKVIEIVLNRSTLKGAYV